MGDLSRNFSKKEFACRCCGRVKVNPKLVAALQELRDLAGVPIHVNSGFRCPAHNKEVGGVKQSQHMQGNAADIVISKMAPAEMFRLAEKVPALSAGGIGVYPDRGFVHVDVRPTRTRWACLGGKYVPVEEALAFGKKGHAVQKKDGGDGHANS